MNRQRLRRVVQVGVVGGLVAIPVMGLLEVGGPTGTLCSVGWGPVSMSCPAGVTQTLLAARSVDWGLLLSALPLVVLALFLGRVFCSWVCPVGLLSEYLAKIHMELRHYDIAEEQAQLVQEYDRHEGEYLIKQVAAHKAGERLEDFDPSSVDEADD